MHDAGIFGPLPTARLIFDVLARVDRNGHHVAGFTMLDALAGLAVLHRRMAEQPVSDGAATPPEDRASSPGSVWAHSSIEIWDEAQHHIRAIDLAAHLLLGDSHPGAVVHHEGLGAVFSRIAFWHSASFRHVVLDGPQGRHRQELGRAIAGYEELCEQLTSGRRRLPPSTAH